MHKELTFGCSVTTGPEVLCEAPHPLLSTYPYPRRVGEGVGTRGAAPMIGLLSTLLCATQGREYCPTYEHNPLEPHDVASCLLPNGTMAPCGPGNQMCPPGPFGRNTPQYHVRDLSCAENDPNGPVYDPVHGVYPLSSR